MIREIIDKLQSKKIARIMANLENSEVRLDKMKKSKLLKDLLESQLINAKEYFKDKKIKYDKLVCEFSKSTELTFKAYKKKSSYMELLGIYSVKLSDTYIITSDTEDIEVITDEEEIEGTEDE